MSTRGQEELLAWLEGAVRDALSGSEVNVVMDAHFEEDLGMDSMSMMAVLTSLERDFSLEIPDEQLGKFSYVRDVIDYIAHAA